MAAAGAALAALGPASTAGQAVAPTAPDKVAAPVRGYHETEHTRRYYELARF